MKVQNSLSFREGNQILEKGYDTILKLKAVELEILTK